MLFVECNTRRESIAAFVRFAYRSIDEELRVCPKVGYDEAVQKSDFSGILGVVKAVKACLGEREIQDFVHIYIHIL